MDSLGEDDGQDSLKEVKNQLRKEKIYEILFKEWENASKMRVWFRQELSEKNLDPENEDHKEQVENLFDSVMKKSEFLIMVKKASMFQSESTQ